MKDLVGGIKLLDQLAQDPNGVFVCKGHWGSPAERDVLLSYEDIRIYLIWRDVRDVLVSQYHSILNDGKTFDDFSDYYRQNGRTHLFQQVAFRNAWRSFEGDPRVHTTDYAGLVEGFPAEASAMMSFSRIEGVDLDDLAQRVSMDRLRVKHNDPEGNFFRRGIVGEYHELAASPAISKDIEQIEGSGTIQLATRLTAHKTRRKLQSIRRRFGGDGL